MSNTTLDGNADHERPPPPSAPLLYPPTVVPPDGALPLGKFLREFPKNPIRSLPRQAYEADVYAYQFRKHVYAWITGPAQIEQILVEHASHIIKTPQEKRVFEKILGESVLTADHDSWRWQRRALAPLFRHADLLAHVPTIARIAERKSAEWRQTGAGTREIDADLTQVTFDVILETMLTGSKASEARDIIASGQRYIAQSPWEMAYALLMLPTWLPHPGTWAMHRAANSLRTSVGAIVDRRLAQGDDATILGPDDLLGRLIAARDPETGKPMNRAQVINNLTTMMEAGHETTAKALTWTLYLLARAPAWQQRVRDEVVRVTGGGRITADHLAQLPGTTRVIKETMRLYPPAPVIARSVIKPIQLDGHRFDIGTQLIFPMFCIHRHRKYWNDPDRFDPDRFLPDIEKTIPRTQYMPFGAGPRICIGQSFAMIEAVTLLATFVRDAIFEWDGKHLPEPVSRVTLHPAGGMPLKMTPL